MMDPIDMYNRYINYKNLVQKGFEEMVDQTLSSTASKLDMKQIYFKMERNDFWKS